LASEGVEVLWWKKQSPVLEILSGALVTRQRESTTEYLAKVIPLAGNHAAAMRKAKTKVQ
jgi:hypothetical protein